MKGSNLYVWLCRQAKGLHWCKEIHPFQNDFYKKNLIFKLKRFRESLHGVCFHSVLACVTELRGQTMPDVENRKLFVSNN